MRVRSLIAVCPVLLFGVLYTGPHEVAYAQTSPGSFGSTLGALVAANAAANGFSAADPRVAATAAAIGARAEALAAAAASAAGEALGAVSWGAVAAAAGIGAMLGAYPVSLGNDTLTKWQFNHDGTVSVYPPSTGAPPGGGSSPIGGSVSPYAALTAGAGYWFVGQVTGSSADAAGEALMETSGATSWNIKCPLDKPTEAVCTGTQTMSDGRVLVPSFSVAQSGSVWAGPTCASGMGTSKGTCAAFTPQQPPPPPPPVTTSPSAAAAGTSAADQADSLNPKVAAATVDALWSSVASQPGYQGLPYPVNAPVTGAQAAGVESSIGASWPTVGSFTGGAGTTAAGGSSTAPFSTSIPAASNPASSVPVATNPGSGAQINIGPDPGIGAPGLEQTPTATQILAPILGMLPDFQHYGLPAHNAACPEPSVTVFGSTVTMTAQCTLSEEFRTQIYVTCVLVFTLGALFVLLTA